MPKQRITKQEQRVSAEHTRLEVAVTGRRREKDVANSLRFLVTVEGVQEYDGHVRGANGMRWRVL